ncbi:hypothetical protein AMELA_G00152890 [Ameiurus melas]|uniref:SPIN-DOC-like zinc-finger domain-containing protein n=1 Tax=Ameiurus melas TaxID=219545 RepID=A0A7J6AKD9_AMEME|nr:hypothetical protein AMELA_G00152890 [Ameiurus melas]
MREHVLFPSDSWTCGFCLCICHVSSPSCNQVVSQLIAESLLSKKMAKRKKDEEYRTFQQEWTEEFAFVERAGSAVCLICNDQTASMKRSNLKRHFDTHHTTFASKYPAGDSREKACQELLCRGRASQQQLRVWTQQDSNVRQRPFRW